MKKVKVFCIFLITISFLHSKVYSQEIEFVSNIITSNADGAESVYAVDVDGDGDMDVLSASSYDNKIAWYENDGDENFSTHSITTSADGALSVYAADVDGDEDMDVLSASTHDNKIAWYENDGNENFTPHTITTYAEGANSVYAVDVDGDGDMDVLSASHLYALTWYENDGDENFNDHFITSIFSSTSSVYAVDVDSDGDMDVLSASFSSDRITWYENDGDENFSEHDITTSAWGAQSVYATDVDDDGDIDVLSASSYYGMDHKIAWYENLQITGINEDNYLILKVDDLKNYPNPFNPKTTINFSVTQTSSFVTLDIYNIKGQKVKHLVSDQLPTGQHSVVWDGRDDNGKSVSSGIYFYKLKTNNFEKTRKMILMK